MSNFRAISTLAVASALGWTVPAHAQTAQQSDALRAEISAMREQMAAMAQQIDTLEGRLVIADTKAEAATQAASQAAASASQSAEKAAAATKDVKVATLEKSNGWSFEPFGRLMIDAGSVDAPDAINDPGLGFANEVRRARIGVKGDIPGGFDYKIELEFADNEVEITDATLGYDAGAAKLTVGQHNNFQSLEELTSSRFTSFMERAAFTDAFGFQRRVGVSAEFNPGTLLVQGGVFTDNIDNLSASNNSWGADGRVVFAPKLGNTQLHLGGSVHWRDFNDGQSSVRYRQRPQVHFTDTRFVDTRSIAATGEFGYGLEFAAINGPFHATGETYWQKASRTAGAADPTFFGGYAEVGYFLTGGDSRTYKGGKFDRIKPKNPVGNGGFGAVQVVARYDYLDLNDAGITGGMQNTYGLSLVWTPTDYTRFMLNYLHNEYDDAAIAAGLTRSYNVDTFGVRAQLDF